MSDKLKCPKCNNLNDIHKFCVFCGEKLLEDDQLKMLNNNQEPYCLNCGRSVKKGQRECECGYKLIDVNCPECNTENTYTNRFCTKCGKKLWTSYVSNWKYYEDYFKINFKSFPKELHHTSLYKRQIENLERSDSASEKMISKLEEYLVEIGSRWKVISPNYCINCLDIMNTSEYICSKCGSGFADQTKVEFLKTNKYAKPKFDNFKFKQTSMYSKDYLNSLSPALGESQFEYMERLKWEYGEKKYHISSIHKKISIQKEIERRQKQQAEQRKQEKEYIRQFGGGYCDSNCRHHYQLFTDVNGDVYSQYCDNLIDVMDQCYLGYSVSLGIFCKHYEK